MFMLKSYKTALSVLILLVTIGLLSACGKKEEQKPQQSAEETKALKETLVKNLTAAYQAEANAKERYQTFGAVATEEGYKGLSALFAAVARSEEIHSNNFLGIIKKLGANAEPMLKQAEWKTTKENLQKAIEIETEDVTKAFPQYLEVAKKLNDADAIKAINGAIETVKGHIEIYKQALSELDNWKNNAQIEVCPVCGFVTVKRDVEKCPVCNTTKDKFETFI